MVIKNGTESLIKAKKNFFPLMIYNVYKTPDSIVSSECIKLYGAFEVCFKELKTL